MLYLPGYSPDLNPDEWVIVAPSDGRPIMIMSGDALAGDPSDGLPGIRGVRSKTAARLLSGGLALDDLPLSGRLAGRTGKAVLDGWEQLLASRNLIRMNANIPIPDPPTGRPSQQLPPAAVIVEELGLW